MTDIVDKATRSRMMSGIRGKNTKPEILLRKALHAKGFRYRLHVKELPGKPDIVLPKYHAVIFVHGCFWHGHGCKFFKVPQTNTAFWIEKINVNKLRDSRDSASLRFAGWRTMTVWECALRRRDNIPDIVLRISAWLVLTDTESEIA